MRISNLYLTAYGPFTDQSIEFSNKKDFHIILGPNEAGKSSALRAIRAFLYGIEERTADNFLHDNKRLRVGGTLSVSSGDSITFYRRKGRKETILNETGTPLPDGVLVPFVPVSDPVTFHTFYGLDHSRLREGGRQLQEIGGDLGRALFIGSGGLTNLSSAMNALDEILNQLWPSRSRQKGLKGLVSKFQEQQKALRQHVLKPSEWIQARRELEKTVNGLEAFRSRESELREAEKRLERIIRSIPLYGSLKRLQKELEELGSVRLLPPDYPYDERRTTSESLKVVRQRILDLETEVDGDGGLKEQLSEVDVDTGVLERKDEIDELAERLGNHKKSQKDASRLIAEVRQTQAEIDRIQMELGMEGPKDGDGLARLTTPQKANLRSLALKYQDMYQEPRRLVKQLGTLETRRKKIKQLLTELPAEQDVSAVRRAANDARKLGDIDADIRSFATQIDNIKREIETAVSTLPLWADSAERLITNPFPLAETITRFEQTLNVLIADKRAASDRLAITLEEIAEIEQKLKAASRLKAVPDLQKLLDMRAQRDTGWTIIKKAWLSSIIDEDEARSYAGDGALEVVYEEAVAEADRIADTMREEADLVQNIAILTTNLQDARKTEADQQAELGEIEKKLEAKRIAWCEEWRDSGIHSPHTPLEMREWMTKREAIVRFAKDLNEYEVKLRNLSAMVADHAANLRIALEEGGVEVVTKNTSLQALIEVGDQHIAAVQSNERRREQLEEQQEEFAEQISELSTQLTIAQTALGEFRGEWQTAIACIGLSSDETAEVVQEVLDKYEDLYRRLDDLTSKNGRIEGIERDTLEFRSDVAKLVGEVAQDLVEVSEEHAVGELRKRLMVAVENRRDSDLLQEQIKTKEAQLGQLRERQESHLTALEKIAEMATCAIQDLELTEKRYEAYAALTEQIKDKRAALATDGGGLSFEAFADVLETFNQDATETELESVKSELEEVRDEIEGLIQLHTELRGKLDGFEREETASEFAERSESLIAEMRRGIREYAVAWLAKAILNSEFQRLREAGKTPTLEAASRALASLTLRSLSELAIDRDERDEAHLVGVRGSDRLEVTAMSDGTVDQLYLALRLAYIQTELAARSSEPMPLILDDILVNFDDERATAALTELANLSAKAQVIFFTHHRHLVDLAEQSASAEKIEVIEMPSLVSA